MTSEPHLLLETLKALKRKKLKEFKWYLKKEGIGSAADLEKADAIDTVDLMEAFCTLEAAVEVTVEILMKMKENNLAQQIKSKQKDQQKHLETAEKHREKQVSEGVKLNLVVCRSDGTLKSSISELILQQADRRSDVDHHGRQISLVFKTLSVEDVMYQTPCCVSLSLPQKYFSGAELVAFICQKLKEPIEQSVYKKTARDLADEMRSNCESLNGNRSNLEKHILKTLAEEEDFNKYMNYIHKPRDHFKSFIKDEVSRYITDKFSVSVLPKMKENIELLQQKIMKAAHESTKHVQVNRGDVGLWLKSFTQKLSDVLFFSEKDLSGVKHDDVDDLNLLEDVMRRELPAIMTEISWRFNRNTFPVKLDYKFRPDELLVDHFCQCCWVQCPFCEAICTNTIENHYGDHSVAFHRVWGINGQFYKGTTNLQMNICTLAVATDRSFNPKGSNDAVLWREYRRAGGVYADWSITPDLSELPYWKWFMCRFQKDLEKYYGKTFERRGKIPDEWKKNSKQEAIQSLDTYI